MPNVTTKNYRKDKYYPRVATATAHLLGRSDEVSPVTILVQMGNLYTQDVDGWYRGEVPYLERVFQGSLSKAGRILRIIGYFAHDLNMVPVQQTYRQRGKRRLLCFSKSRDPNIERAYTRHFRWNQSQEKKKQLIRRILNRSDADGVRQAIG